MVVDLTEIDEIFERNPQKPSSLIAVLQDIQRKYHYLPRPALEQTAEILSVPLSKVYSAATFYAAFSLTPKGRKIIRVCKGTACHIRGAENVLDQLDLDFELKPGDTTPDLEYTLEVVNCVGACAMAPVVIVNDKYHGNVRADKISKMVKKG